MRSLSVKLIGAFALVILLGAAITYLVAGQTLSSQYRLYVNQRGQLRAANWAPPGPVGLAKNPVPLAFGFDASFTSAGG